VKISMKGLQKVNDRVVNSLEKKVIGGLLLSEEEHAQIINAALSKLPVKRISWQDVYRFLELSLKLKGYLSEEKKPQTNIALVIQK